MSTNGNQPNKPEEGETRPFWLDFRFDDSEASRSALDADTPRPKGEVYFANSTRTFQPLVQEPAAAPGQKEKQAKGKKEKRARGGKSGGGAIAALLAPVLAATAVLSVIGIATLRDIFALGKSSDSEDAYIVSLSIPDNMTTDQAIDLLAENRLVKQKAMCKLYMRFTEHIKNQNTDDPGGEPELPGYVAGEYEVESSMGLEEMLGSFLPKPSSGETINLLFPEGYTVKRIMAKIGENKVSNVTLLKRSMLATSFDYPFLKGLNTDGRYYKYEGYLFPDTYEFYIDENANSVLRRFFDNFQAKWKEEYTTKAAEMGYTVDQIIIMASIIQKEAAGPEQMKDISGVLHNRLDHPSVYPMLECNSTLDYAMSNIATEMDPGAAVMYNDAYNTYKCTGLPVGPICNPSLSAIEAALNPNTHEYFYFQHDKNGEMYLNKTKQEHNDKTVQLVRDGLAQ
ncbi:MAG: endolytic transglycosylase MltG [Firmicutes bacterium]|nr:endolytic transglycosylase MltG [Bacillota bacterium]